MRRGKLPDVRVKPNNYGTFTLTETEKKNSMEVFIPHRDTSAFGSLSLLVECSLTVRLH